MQITNNDALIVVDMQNDFCEFGALAVPGANEIIPTVNNLIEEFYNVGATVVLTQDWHPAEHSSFVRNSANGSWPNHCVQGTFGAEFHGDIDTTLASLIIRKGMNPDIDSYSGFMENDKATMTGLGGYLFDRNVRRVFICGLAYDFCVGWTALDSANEEFETYIIRDACRAIDVNGSAAKMSLELADKGVEPIEAWEIS